MQANRLNEITARYGRSIDGRFIFAPQQKRVQEKLQSPSAKRRFLAGMQARGRLEEVYLFIQARLPMKDRRGLTDDGIESVLHPRVWLPVIKYLPVPADAEMQGALLRSMFVDDNDPAFEFVVAATEKDVLDAWLPGRWYEWTEGLPVVDQLCPLCGIITQQKADLPVTGCLRMCK